MFKQKLLVGLIVSLVSSVALADGYYAGLGVGGTYLQNKDKVTLSIAGYPTASSSKNNYDFGALVSGFAGYQWSLPNKFNLAIEAFANGGTAKYNISNSIATGNVKQRSNYGARLVPGYQMTANTDLHAIVGYVRGNFKATGTATSTGQTFSNSDDLNGYQLGLGVGTKLVNHLALRGDVIYSDYPNKVRDYSGVSPTNLAYSGSTKNQYSTIDGVVALSYTFG